MRPRTWDSVDLVSELGLRVRLMSGVEFCVGLGLLKAEDIRLEAPLAGREIIDGAAEEG